MEKILNKIKFLRYLDIASIWWSKVVPGSVGRLIRCMIDNVANWPSNDATAKMLWTKVQESLIRKDVEKWGFYLQKRRWLKMGIFSPGLWLFLKVCTQPGRGFLLQFSNFRKMLFKTFIGYLYLKALQNSTSFSNKSV